MLAARLVLLFAGVAGAVLRPWRLPAFVAPVVCALVVGSTGLLSWEAVATALRPFAAPLGFLLAAIPLAVLLDRYGYFEQVASRLGSGPWLVPGLWLLGAVTVAVLNLDAAVVLLTPLYVRVARGQGRPERFLGFQPALLALLASCFLPVSNLTNLLAEAHLGFGPIAVVEHLALPAATACLVGYFCYRGSSRPADSPPRGPGAEQPVAAATRAPVRVDRRVLVTGSVAVALLLVGFVVGPSFGVGEWEIALGADAVLVALTRSLPARSIPFDIALVAGGLGVLAAAAAKGMDLGAFLSGTGPLAEVAQALAAAGGANVVNNLPALLVALPFLSGPGGHATCALWPVLLGVNTGPGLLVTGSLASLLWMGSMRQLEVPVSPLQYLRMGVRVVLPAFAAALAVLVLLGPAVGCG